MRREDAHDTKELPADTESEGGGGGHQRTEDDGADRQIYRVHPNLVGKWKQAALAKLPEVFRQPNQKATPADAEKAELYEQIGRLSVELDWLKKRSGVVG